MKVVELDQNM